MKNIGAIIITLSLLLFSAGCTNAQERQQQAIDRTIINMDTMNVLSDNIVIVGSWKINHLIMGNEVEGWRINSAINENTYN